MKILVGYKGTNVGKDLLALSIKHAKAFDGKVHLITSLPGGKQTSREQVAEAEENLSTAGKHLTEQGIRNDIHLLVRGNTASEDILAFAMENDCEEIILGVKSRSKVGKLLFGSTAQHVILKAQCPVISVK